jgi:hypothetical protein
MGAEEVRSCLYTKRLTQKLKKWQDGSILIDRSVLVKHLLYPHFARKGSHYLAPCGAYM